MPNLKINNKQYAGVNKAQFVDANTTQLVTFSHLEDVGTQEATSADIINGQAAYTPEGEKIVGTMPVNTNQTITLDVNNPEYIIPRGYHSGESKVKIEPYVAKMVSSDIEQNLTADDGKVISSVEVKGISKEPAPMNIVYGLAAPGIPDRDKLWVKTAQEPSEVIVKPDIFFYDGMFEPVSSLQTSASWVQTEYYNDKLYMIDTRVRIYDLKSKKITTLTGVKPTNDMATARVDDQIYIFGGYIDSDTNSNIIYKLDTKTDTITQVSGATFSGRTLQAKAIGKKIYIMGGYHGVSSLVPGGTATISEYDTEVNQIIALPVQMPYQMRYITLASYEKKLFLFGGFWTYNDGWPSYPQRSGSISDIYCLDTEAYTLEKLPTSLPVASYGSTAVTIGENIYLFGGSVAEMQKSIYKFNVNDYSLIKMDEELPGNISNKQAAYAGWDKGVYIPNIPITGGQKIHRFVLESYLPYNTLYLQSTLTSKLFEIYPNFEIGIQNAYLGDSAGEAQLISTYLYDNEWINIRTGLADETDAWQTGDSVYIINAGVAEEDNETIIIEKGES